MAGGMDGKYCVNCDKILLDAEDRNLGEELEEKADCCDNPIVRFITPQAKPEGTEVSVIENGE